MVNRRVLRIKAVKNLYAYESCKLANHDLVIDKIQSDFAQDLNSMEPYDAPAMKKLTEESVSYFKAFFQNNPLPKEISTEAKISGDNAIQLFKTRNKEDFSKIKKDLARDFDQIREVQALVWKLIKEFSLQNRRKVMEKVDMSEKFGQQASSTMPFYNNVALNKILGTPEVEDALTREKASWANDEDKVWDWYKSIIRKDTFFEAYLKNPNPTEEEDIQALDECIRRLIFKNDAIETFFDEKDLNWNENKQIVRSLVLKTLKSVNEPEGIVYPPLSYNWEEDLEYYMDLFSETIKNNDYYEDLIEKKVKNWKMERLASLDRVILKTAICEMITFASIPVKVSINEFIEISKTYSTPKSKKFVNGLLDAISEELINSGEIRKSGRGLIDSK